MNTTTAPTAASLLIDVLTPTQRAVLKSAFDCYEHEVILALDDHLNNTTMAPTLAGRITEFYKWNIKNLKEIKHTMFAECFTDDLELLQHFQRELPPLKKPQANEKPASRL